MRKSTTGYLLTVTLFAVLLTACSGDKTSNNSSSPSPTTAKPAKSSNTTTNTSPAATATSSISSNLPTSGKVIRAMHAGGYTYIQMEDDEGRQFWVATDMMNVKRDDHISWASAALQKDFNSSSLHRHFDEILFVTSARNEH